MSNRNRGINKRTPVSGKRPVSDNGPVKLGSIVIGVAVVIIVILGLILLIDGNPASLLQPTRLIWVIVGAVAAFWIFGNVSKRR